jgi:hypothetical protein
MTQRPRKLGKAIGIVAAAEVVEQCMHEDLSAFYAPSECHRDVRKGEVRRQRSAWRHAKSVSGLTRWQFRQAMKRLPRRQFERAVASVYDRMHPWV